MTYLTCPCCGERLEMLDPEAGWVRPADIENRDASSPNPNVCSPMVGALDPSLDNLAAEVRCLRSEESAAADEACILRRLLDEAATRQGWAADLRQTAERRLRDAYNDACKP